MSIRRCLTVVSFCTMSKKTSLLGLLGIGYVSLLLLFLNGKYDSPSMYETQSSTALPERVKNNTVAAETKIDPALKRIGEITNRQRKYISNDMKKYEYPNGKYNISASKLEDLTLETNGTPIRRIIVTTWRSGSTFLGDILNAHPANFYHYEPLLAFDIVKVRGPPLSEKALNWVKDLLNCEYQDLVIYGVNHANRIKQITASAIEDYEVAVELLKQYPNRFKVIRYEDLSLDPYKHVEELYKFYGLYLHPKTRTFLDSHTKISRGGVSSTFRNSKEAPFHWKTDLEYEEVEKIQESCTTAMKYWGYVPAMNATHQKEFNPLTNYVLEL